MRENYRNSIASINKFPQFTTMNVIDGQAGLVIYASLIFYSLTVDNILNIIVLLILAGVSIQMLTGQNGILQRTGDASTKHSHAVVYENIQLEYFNYITDKSLSSAPTSLIQYLQNKQIIGNKTEDGWYVIDTVKLTGSKQPYGNGTDGKTDVYVLIKDTESASLSNLKVASTNPINIADNSAGREENYKVMYIGMTEESSDRVYLGKLFDEKSQYIDYSYVEYDVEYTDVYDENKKYTKNTGWRLLTNLGDKEVTSENINTSMTYTGDVELISTGIPAGLYLFDTYITRSGYNIWAGNSSDITNYLSEGFYGSSSGAKMNVVSGLYYNFGRINFKKQDSKTTVRNNEYNGGYYTTITKNGIIQDGTITGEVFISRNDAKVRSVTLADIRGNKASTDRSEIYDSTDARPGLFRLSSYTPEVYNTGTFWLASPGPGSSKTVLWVVHNGRISGGGNAGWTIGVRPVISLSGVTLTRTAGSHIWKIQ